MFDDSDEIAVRELKGYMNRAENVVKSFCKKKDVEPKDLLTFLALVEMYGALTLYECTDADETLEDMGDAIHELSQAMLKDITRQAKEEQIE